MITSKSYQTTAMLSLRRSGKYNVILFCLTKQTCIKELIC